MTLFKQLLRSAGAKYVLHFELYKNERLIYAIFFATQHAKGCDVMKKAMWKTAPFGDFKFKSGTANQLTLGIETVNTSPLRKALHEEFGDKDWVRIESIENFMKTDKTEFHTGHLKKQTLAPMEDEGVIEVDPRTRKRRKTFPNGAKLRFTRP